MLYDKLKNHSQNGSYPFHTPGHKRNFGSALPYDIDITEIDGFDNLRHPQGCIREIEKKAERLYKAKRAFISVNGATGAVLAAVHAMTKHSDKVLIARNCHLSVHNAVNICGLNAVYYLPDPPRGDRVYPVFGGVDPDLIDIALEKNQGVRLVVITSPTYEGIVSDVESIARACHDHGAALLVDEAHGSHFPFSGAFPQSSAVLGADASIVSLHKTMPSMTQTALLLLNKTEYEGAVQSSLNIFQTSSPSYVLMSSIERCLDFADESACAFERYIKRIERFEHAARKFKSLRLLFHEDNGEISNIFDYDRGRLVISAYGTDLSGVALAELLRKDYDLEVEMAAEDYIILITSVCDTDEGFDRLISALLSIDKSCKHTEVNAPGFLLTRLPEKGVFDPDASRLLPVSECEGKASGESVYAYPPGIPIVCPGEIITREITDMLDRLTEKGVNVYSSLGNYPHSLLIADL